MSTRSFKTTAWSSKEAASTYHKSTTAAPKLFQFIRERLFIRYIERYAAAGARILDVGCGSGLVAVALHDKGYKVTASDASPGMLEVLKQEAGSRKIDTRLGDAFAIPGKDNEFDLVVSRMFIQHFAEWPRVLAEKARVTRPGGIVMFDFGSQEHVDASPLTTNPGMRFPYSDDATRPADFYAAATESAMRRAANAVGLDVVEISPLGLLFCNAFLWDKLKADGIDELNARLDTLLESEQAVELLTIIEETLMPLLPKSVTYGNMTVLRRRA